MIIDIFFTTLDDGRLAICVAQLVMTPVGPAIIIDILS